MQPKESKSTWHFIVSMIKSAIRILAGVALVCAEGVFFESAGMLLIAAEMLGILEEF